MKVEDAVQSHMNVEIKGKLPHYLSPENSPQTQRSDGMASDQAGHCCELGMRLLVKQEN